MSARQQTLEYKAKAKVRDKLYSSLPERQAKNKARKSTPEYLAQVRLYQARPEAKERRRTLAKQRRNNPKFEEWEELRRMKRRARECTEAFKVKLKHYKRLQNTINPSHKIGNSIRSRIALALKRSRTTKQTRTIRLLGCSFVHLREHLEKQFLPGMTWQNRGINGWHIDHVVPLSGFDLTDKAQQHIAFHYSNLQPMWAEHNLKKAGMIPHNHQPMLPLAQ